MRVTPTAAEVSGRPFHPIRSTPAGPAIARRATGAARPT
jgi:hypothetical protein